MSGKFWFMNTFRLEFTDLRAMDDKSIGNRQLEALFPLGEPNILSDFSRALQPIQSVTDITFNEKSKSFWYATLDLKTNKTQIVDISDGSLFVDKEAQEEHQGAFDQVNFELGEDTMEHLQDQLKDHFLNRILKRNRFSHVTFETLLREENLYNRIHSIREIIELNASRTSVKSLRKFLDNL